MAHLQLFAAVLSVSLGFAGGALGQGLPSSDWLEGRLATVLPAYWDVSDLSIVATTRAGDAARPLATIRFEARAVPAMDLYLKVNEDGPFDLIVPGATEGTRRHVYGVASIAYSAGEWDGEIAIENPVEGLGQPSDMFLRPTLVVGSADAETVLASLRTALHEDAESNLERELAAMRMQHERSRSDLMLSQLGELAELQAQHEAELQRVNEETAAQLAALTAGRQTQLAAAAAQTEELLQARRNQSAAELAGINDEHAARVAALRARQAEELARLSSGDAERERQLAAYRQTTEQALDALRSAAEADIDALRAEHARRRGELIATQQQELAEIETRLATERRSLQRQLEAARDVVQLRTALAAVLAERDRQVATMARDLEAGIRARTAIFAALPQHWGGVGRCQPQPDNGQRFQSSIALEISQRGSNGFQFQIRDEHDISFSIQANLSQEDPAFPFSLRFGPFERSNFLYLSGGDMVIDQVGRMTMTGVADWVEPRNENRQRGYQGPVQCVFELSARQR